MDTRVQALRSVCAWFLEAVILYIFKEFSINEFGNRHHVCTYTTLHQQPTLETPVLVHHVPQ